MNDETNHSPLKRAMDAVDRGHLEPARMADRPVPETKSTTDVDSALANLSDVANQVGRKMMHDKAAPPAQTRPEIARDGHQRVPTSLEVLTKALALLVASHGRVMACTEAIIGMEPGDPLMFTHTEGDPVSTQIREISMTITEIAHQIDSAMAHIRATL